jgi:hypothetical protein
MQLVQGVKLVKERRMAPERKHGGHRKSGTGARIKSMKKYFSEIRNHPKSWTVFLTITKSLIIHSILMKVL